MTGNRYGEENYTNMAGYETFGVEFDADSGCSRADYLADTIGVDAIVNMVACGGGYGVSDSTWL